jgi:hypothetical protein
MSDDEILELANGTFTTAGRSTEFIDFARAIEQRTLTNQKARWYQEGVEAEREACAELCENITDIDEDVDDYYSHIYATAIRARGE